MNIKSKFKKSLPIIASLLISSSLVSCTSFRDDFNRNFKGVPPKWQDDLEFGKPTPPALNPGGNAVVHGKKYYQPHAEKPYPYELIQTSNSSSYNSNTSSYNSIKKPNFAEYPSFKLKRKLAKENLSPTVSYAPAPKIEPISASISAPRMQNVNKSSISTPKATLNFNPPNQELGFTPSALEPTGDLGTPPWMKADSGAFGGNFKETSSSFKPGSSEDLTNYGGDFDPYSDGDFPDKKFNPPSYKEIESMGGDPFSPMRYNQEYSYTPRKLEYRTKYSDKKPTSSSESERRMPVMNKMVFEQKGQFSYESAYDPTIVSQSAFKPAPIPTLEPIKSQPTYTNNKTNFDFLKVEEQPAPARMQPAPSRMVAPTSRSYGQPAATQYQNRVTQTRGNVDNYNRQANNYYDQRSPAPQYQQNSQYQPRTLQRRVQEPVKQVKKENPFSSMFSKVKKSLGLDKSNNTNQRSNNLPNYESKLQQTMRNTNYSGAPSQNYGYAPARGQYNQNGSNFSAPASRNVNNYAANNYQRVGNSYNAQPNNATYQPAPPKKNIFSKFVDKYIKTDSNNNNTANRQNNSNPNIYRGGERSINYSNYQNSPANQPTSKPKASSMPANLGYAATQEASDGRSMNSYSYQKPPVPNSAPYSVSASASAPINVPVPARYPTNANYNNTANASTSQQARGYNYQSATTQNMGSYNKPASRQPSANENAPQNAPVGRPMNSYSYQKTASSAVAPARATSPANYNNPNSGYAATAPAQPASNYNYQPAANQYNTTQNAPAGRPMNSYTYQKPAVIKGTPLPPVPRLY